MKRLSTASVDSMYVGKVDKERDQTSARRGSSVLNDCSEKVGESVKVAEYDDE